MLCLAACPVPAAAQSSTISGPTFFAGGASYATTIPVTASVGGRCGFATGSAPSGVYDAGAIDTTAWSHQFAFVLDCNGASRVAVVSANGGLLGSTAPGVTGYTNLAPYTVLLNLVGSAGATASASCAAADLKTGTASPCSYIGTASQTTGLRVASASQNLTGSYLQVSAPAFPGPDVLASGTYSDTLTISVAAAP